MIYNIISGNPVGLFSLEVPHLVSFQAIACEALEQQGFVHLENCTSFHQLWEAIGNEVGYDGI
jgi:hypothetical protein